jgi:hypothetical protein
MNNKTPPRTVFDGYCERGFDENMDGWILEQLDERDIPSVQMAKDILALYAEANALRRENWQLRKDLARWWKR